MSSATRSDKRLVGQVRRILPPIASLVALTAGMAIAQVPDQIAYQGLLYDNGTAVDNSNATLVFSIFTSASSGTALWTETQTGVTVSAGQFFVYLGSVSSLTSVAFDVPYWLEVTYESTALSPRLKLVSVAFARTAATAETAPFSGLSGVPAAFSDEIDDTSNFDLYNCSNYIIPYMPYSVTAEQFIFFIGFRNLQKSVYAIDTSQSDQPELRSSGASLGGEGSPSVILADFEGTSAQISYVDHFEGVIELTGLEAALTTAGFDGSGKVSFDIDVYNSGFWAVHAAFSTSADGPLESVQVECVQ